MHCVSGFRNPVMAMMSVGRCVGVHARPLLSRRVRLGGVLVPTPPNHADAAQGGLCRASFGEEEKSLSETKEPAEDTDQTPWLEKTLDTYKVLIYDILSVAVIFILIIPVVVFPVAFGYFGITFIARVFPFLLSTVSIIVAGLVALFVLGLVASSFAEKLLELEEESKRVKNESAEMKQLSKWEFATLKKELEDSRMESQNQFSELTEALNSLKSQISKENSVQQDENI